MKKIELMQKNTQLLWKSFLETENKLLKIEILLAVFDNLQLLRKEMTSQNFDQQFGEIDTKVQTILKKITDIQAVKALLKKVNKLLESESELFKKA